MIQVSAFVSLFVLIWKVLTVRDGLTSDVCFLLSFRLELKHGASGRVFSAEN